jgi:hypothetical protein
MKHMSTDMFSINPLLMKHMSTDMFSKKNCTLPFYAVLHPSKCSCLPIMLHLLPLAANCTVSVFLHKDDQIRTMERVAGSIDPEEGDESDRIRMRERMSELLPTAIDFWNQQIMRSTCQLLSKKCKLR